MRIGCLLAVLVDQSAVLRAARPSRENRANGRARHFVSGATF